MNIIKIITVITFTALWLLIASPLYAENHTKNTNENNTVTFKHVMQGLLSETKEITEGIILENFTLVENAANRIVNHPKPAMEQRKKLMKALGDEASTFKSFDHIVHGGAVKIMSAAKSKNMTAVIIEYEKLITGCQSCHHQFKDRLAIALQ